MDEEKRTEETEELEITEEEVREILAGVDKDGDSKSAIGATLVEVDENGSENIVAEFALTDTVLTNFFFADRFFVVELDFKSMRNVWLRRFLELEEQYQSDTGRDFLGLTFTDIMGIFKYTLTVACPLICVTGVSKETGQTSIVKMIFSDEDVMLGDIDYSFDEIRADVARNETIEQYEIYRSEELEAENRRIIDEMEDNTGFMGDQFGLDKVIKTPEEKREEDSKIRFTKEDV